MRITGKHRYDADPELLCTLFTDREALLKSTPGLRALEQVEPDLFRAELRAGLGVFQDLYLGTVQVVDRDPPNGLKLLLRSTTEKGYANADVLFRFQTLEGGQTELLYEAEIELGGGQGLYSSLARGLMEFFLHGMQEVLKGRRRGRAAGR